MATPDVAELLRECLETGETRPCGKFLESIRRTIAVSVVIACRPFGDLGREAAEDLVQETCLKLFRGNYRAMRDLEGAEPRAILAFVRSVAVTTTLDYFRSETALKRTGGHARVPLGDEHHHDGCDFSRESIEQKILLDQIDRTLRASEGEMAGRDRQIFWLHYRHGLTAKDIAGMEHFGLSVKGVESLLFRLIAKLRKHFPKDEEGFSRGSRLEEGEG